MSTTPCLSPLQTPFVPSPLPSTLRHAILPPCSLPLLRRRRHCRHSCFAMKDFLGDFGARDPYPEELASSFGEKVLGCPDTEHKILIPNLAALSLAQLCCDAKYPALAEEDARKLLRKVVGWRLVEDRALLKLQCLWKVRDYECGMELINRIYKVAKNAGHYPSLHVEPPNEVRAEFWTQSLGGLTMNDFIVAAKIDEIKTQDLIPKKRMWA